MKKSLLATLPVAAFVAGMAVVPNTFAEASTDNCTPVDATAFAKDLAAECPTITLGGNIELETTFATIDKPLTINLGQYNITRKGGTGTVLNITSGGDLTLTGTTGAVESDVATSATIWVADGEVTIGNGATVKNTNNGFIISAEPGTINIEAGAKLESTGSNGSGVSVNGASSKLNITGGSIATNGTSVNVFGTNPEVTISGGDITAKNGFALSGNGSQTTGSKITISDAASLTSTNNAAIYNPQDGTLTVDGSTITGATGILARQGTVNINGGTIVANGDGTISGTTTAADGIQKGVAVLTDGEGVTATVDGDNTVLRSTGAPVLALNAETPGDQITIGAGVKIESSVAPDAAYLDGLVVGPNGVVMTEAEAEKLAEELASQNKPAAEEVANPNTADPIALYATVAVLAVLGLGATAVLAKKSNR